MSGDEFLKQVETLETGKPSIAKVDKKLSFVIINVNNFLETQRKLDNRLCKVENQLTWGKGWATAFGLLMTTATFFFIKMYNKIFP